MLEQTVLKTIGMLAHDNRMTVASFLEKLEKEYTVDISGLEKNQEGYAIYPDGNIALPIDLPDEDFIHIVKAAESKGIILNDLMIQAVTDHIEFLKTENPEEFADKGE